MQSNLTVSDLKFSKTIKNISSKQFLSPGIWISDYILINNPCEKDETSKYSKIAIYTTFTSVSPIYHLNSYIYIEIQR